jgi:hypothetical protein
VNQIEQTFTALFDGGEASRGRLTRETTGVRLAERTAVTSVLSSGRRSRGRCHVAASGHGDLYEFVTGVSNNTDRLQAFNHDPEGAMRAANLSEEHKGVLRSWDSARLTEALAAAGHGPIRDCFVWVPPPPPPP